MKILFIVPPNITFDKFIHPPEHNSRIIIKKDGKTYGNVITEISLGCLAMSSYIKRYEPSIKTELIDFGVILNKLDSFTYYNFEDLFFDYLSKVKETPDIICITSLFMQVYNSTLEIAKRCRKLWKSSTIVLGGGVPTNLYQRIFKECDDIDGICFGEGEIALLSLVQNGDFRNSSWTTKDQQTPQYNFIQNLDEIPLYDYGLINVEDYNNSVTTCNPALNCVKSIQYMTSRGCIHKCTFCSSHSIHGNKMRYHSIKRIKKDLDYFKSINIKTVVFQDDNILSNKSRFKEILQYLQKLQLLPFFQNGLSIHLMDKKILQLLKDVGTQEIILPIESGSDKVLKQIMKKPLNCAIIKRVVNDCNELGLYTNANIIIGLPGETKEDIEDSIKFLKTLSVNWYHIFNFSPLVGSYLYQICIDNGYIKKDISYMDDYKTPIVNTENFDSKYIEQKMYEMNLELNFIYNYDYINHQYDRALIGFKNAIKAKPTHALAYYFINKCYKQLNKPKLAYKYMELCKQYQDDFWKSVFNKYGIII